MSVVQCRADKLAAIRFWLSRILFLMFVLFPLWLDELVCPLYQKLVSRIWCASIEFRRCDLYIAVRCCLSCKFLDCDISHGSNTIVTFEPVGSLNRDP